MEYGQPRVWAEIYLDNIVFNCRQARTSAGGREVFGIVKANAYGHGAAPVARALAEAGVERFAVAAPEEALQLRRHGIKQPILLLGMADASWAKPLAEKDIALTVGDMPTAHAYAAALNKPAKIHIKLETGMGRTGLNRHTAVQEIAEMATWPNFQLEGIYTHLSSADMPEENDFTRLQVDRFNQIVAELEQMGINIPLKHCANSAGIVEHSYSHADMIRPGIMLYGSPPRPGLTLELRPTMAVRARIAQVQSVPKGTTIGYGRAWFAPRDSVIATVTSGYADGMHRVLSGKLPLLVHGQEARLVGRICMDMCMVDVTDIEGVKPGDVATIMGEDGELRITVDDIAEAAHTIAHEIYCSVGLRVPRLYYQNGRQVGRSAYVEEL